MGGVLFYTCLRGRAGDGAAMREVAAAVWRECSPAVDGREARGEKEERWPPLAAVQGAREAGKGWLGVRRRSLPQPFLPRRHIACGDTCSPLSLWRLSDRLGSGGPFRLRLL
ncbi:hypothetical protein HMPREF0262_03589 [Clostridium sp. ATCC 29733]|nr:hypothetical protein HMPREF0262_03589 [Clostridium sp. ATCC 29733]